MYLYNRSLAGVELQRPTPLNLRHRGVFHSGFSPFSARLGEAASVVPKGLKLLDHIHTPAQPHPTTPGSFVAGAPAKLEVKNMNPGFIDASDQLMTDTSANGLQTCLHKLITTKFQNFLSNKSNTASSSGDRLRVALVDLTGNKITQPDFAGWGSTLAMYGASVPKILAVYAVHQLRRDLRELAASQGISDGKKLKQTVLQSWKLRQWNPDLNGLFDLHKWTGSPVALDFNAATQKLFDGIMHNAEAGTLIAKVGFPYIASVTWQSGLYHPASGGLWLTSSYGYGSWGANPVAGVQSANLTALSAATYFTLLAQGRLTDSAASSAMIRVLRGGCITKHFPSGLGVVASKCGVYGGHWHDCALIARSGIRYAVAGLSKLKYKEEAQYTQLFQELDQLIVRNNQSPKAAC